MHNLTQTHFIRPRVLVRTKNNDFVEPLEAPGEGRRVSPQYGNDSEPEKKEINPIKKWIMKVFKIEEINYEKFRKENKWAIRPPQSKD